jgi:DNA ligase (NAD+)
MLIKTMRVKKDITKIKIADLEREVRRHNRLYFIEHKPEISDQEFDRLVEELRRRKPGSKVLGEIGSDVTGRFKKVRHETLMLSLDKAYDLKTMEDWAEKFEGDIIVSPKIDGCAMSIRYDGNGKLSLAATRGNGAVGEDVTANVGFIKDIPQKIGLKNVEVRGEAYMRLSVFARYRAEFANPRNLTAGAIKQKDPKKTGEYDLSFWAYDLLGAGAKNEAEKRRLLKDNGFPVIESKLMERGDIQSVFEEYLKRRAKFDFEMDGVVYKANDCSEQERLGVTAHHPRYGIAYKFQGDSGITTLKDVEWSVARTGVITPVGIVEPVELSGAMVSRVSLHNVGLMKKLGLSRGAKVMMTRRGGVIPNLESVVEPGRGMIEEPSECPSCGAKVELRDDFLYCTRPRSAN